MNNNCKDEDMILKCSSKTCVGVSLLETLMGVCCPAAVGSADVLGTDELKLVEWRSSYKTLTLYECVLVC